MFKSGIYTALVAFSAALDVTTYRTPIVSLIDGELLPDADDKTYFGGVCGGSSRVHRFRLVDRAAVKEVVVHAPEGEISAAVQYEDGDWSASYSGGSTFTVSFSPKSGPSRESAATILLLDSDGHTLFMFGVGGTSKAPQLAFTTFLGEPVTEVDLSDGNAHSFRAINYGSCQLGALAPTDDGLMDDVSFSIHEDVDGPFVTLQADIDVDRQEGTLILTDAKYNSVAALNIAVGPAPSAPTPGVSCTDYMLSDGSGVWHDSYGAEKGGCDTFYADGSQCAKWGDTSPNDGWVANKACCACGGGVPPGETQPEKPAATCKDHILSNGQDWHDSWGVQNGRCFDWYDLDPARCTTNEANYGYSSMDACCSCGGGSVTGDANVIQVSTCKDKTLSDGAPWQDSYPGGAWACSNYASNTNACDEYGGSYPTEDMTAQDACCACGGGSE